MRYVKAVTLIGGALLLVIAFTDAAARRADASDAHRRAVELSARLSAAQIDGDIAGTAAALLAAPASSSLDRLRTSLGMDVCSSTDPTGCDVDRASVELAAERADVAGWAALVVDGETVLVAAGDDPGAVVAVLAVPDPGHHPVIHRVGSGPADSNAAATAALDTEFVAGRWTVTIDGDVVDGGSGAFGAGALVAIAALMAIGVTAVVWSLVAIGRDLRGLRRQATTDALTGLPNRAEFERRAAVMLARAERDDSGACLVVLDLDRFKAINDTAGHAAGDRVLVEAAGRLRRAVRESDIVGRWGGDEFVLLLAGVGDPLAVPDRVSAIGASLAGIPTTDGRVLTATLGAAVAPLEGRALQDLLEVADRAMYRNKTAVSGVGDRRLT